MLFFLGSCHTSNCIILLYSVLKIPTHKMHAIWKRFGFCHQHHAKRIFSTIHYKDPSSESIEKHSTVITFKERSFAFFQKSASYQELCVPSNKLLSLPIGQKKNLAADTSELSVSETVRILKQLAQDSASQNGALLEKDIIKVLDGCSGKEALLLASTLFQMVGEKFKKGVFYQFLIFKAHKWIQAGSTLQELVLWAFLCSLEKSKQSSICIRSIYEHFKTDASLFQLLNTFEMSILCNTWFSNNLVVSSKPMLRVIDHLLRKEIDTCPGFVSQEALSMLKVLRKAGFGTDQLFESLLLSLSSPPARTLNLAQATHA